MLESRRLLADGISPAPGPALHAIAGAPLSDVTFATYSVTDPSGGPGDQWRALINFGDGQVDGPLIPIEKGGAFAFIDTHTYQSPGTYTATVMIAVPGSHQPNDNTVTTQVTVTAAAPTPTPTASPVAAGLTFRARAERTFQGTVARLNDPQAGARQLTALISWGDGSPSTSGHIRSRRRGGLQIVGAHSYDRPGRFSVLVTIRDGAGHEIGAGSTAIVVAHR